MSLNCLYFKKRNRDIQDLLVSLQTIRRFDIVLRAENKLENVFIIVLLLSKLQIEHLDGQPGSMISDILGRNGGMAIPRWQWMES